MNDPELNGDRSSWLRCYRCWATDLEVQLHYDAILRVDPESGEPSERAPRITEDELVTAAEPHAGGGNRHGT